MNNEGQCSIDLEIEIHAYDSHFVATCVHFPGLTGAGTTEADAKMALIHSLKNRLDDMQEVGQFRLPKPIARSMGWIKYVAAVVVAASIVCALLFWQMQTSHSKPQTEQVVPPLSTDTSPKKAEPQSTLSEVPTAAMGQIPIHAPYPDKADVASKPTDAIVKVPGLQMKTVVVNYDQVFKDADDFHLPSIALLRRHALKGVATAQVCYARLVKSWGYDLEARAWANKLAPFVDKQGVGFLVHFNRLCYDLEQLDSLPDQAKIWRNPDEVESIQLLKQAALKGSASAAYEVGETYRQYSSHSGFESKAEPKFDPAIYAAESLQWFERAVTMWQQDEKDNAERLWMLALHVSDLTKIAGDNSHHTLQAKPLLERAANCGGWWEAQGCAMDLSGGWVVTQDIAASTRWLNTAAYRANKILSDGTDAEKHFMALRIKNCLWTASKVGGEEQWARFDKMVSNLPTLLNSPNWIWAHAAKGWKEKAKVKGDSNTALTKELESQIETAIQAVSDAIERGIESEEALAPIFRQLQAGFLYHARTHFLPDEEGRLENALLEAAAKLGHLEAAYSRGLHASSKRLRRFEDAISNMPSKQSESTDWAYDVEEKWYRIAASAGHVQAQLAFADMLHDKSNFFQIADSIRHQENGKNSPVSKLTQTKHFDLVKTIQIEEERLIWLLKAAKQDSRAAQIQLCAKGCEDEIIGRQGFESDAYMWGLIAGLRQQPNKNDYKILPEQLPAYDSQKNCAMNLLDLKIRTERLPVDFDRAKEAALKFTAKPEIVVSLPNAPILRAGSGTGFFITPHLIVTNAHVVDGWQTATIEDSQGQHMTATVEFLDEKNDLAVLSTEVPPSQSFLRLHTGGAELAEEVFTIGFPNPDIQGTNAKYTDGKISSDSGLNDDIRFYQTTVPVQPGNSGGPLINASGQVIGVMTARLSDVGMLRASGSLPQNVSYAIKADYLVPLLRGLSEPNSSNQHLIPNKQERSALVKQLKAAVVRIVVGME